MASLFSSISKLVSGGPALPYTLGDEPYSQAWGCWMHYPATAKDDGSPASVFKLTASDPNDLKLAAARNGVKRLRMVRALVLALAAATCWLRWCMRTHHVLPHGGMHCLHAWQASLALRRPIISELQNQPAQVQPTPTDRRPPALAHPRPRMMPFKPAASSPPTAAPCAAAAPP